MTGIQHPCAGGCGKLVPKGRRRCSSCERTHQRGRKAQGRTGQRGTSAEWRRQRAKALRRDNHRCTTCGSSHRLEVHHIDGNPNNNALVNLTTLCYVHHQEAERAKRQQQRRQHG